MSFDVRTTHVYCKPVKKVLPCRSSIRSNDPFYDILLAADHDGEEVKSAPSILNSYNDDDVTHDVLQLLAIVLKRKQQEEDEILAAFGPMLYIIDQSLFFNYYS
ncbi:hypothetical protein CTI12_AA399120 [Artemisia annua]|uniref:Uncharacterized protein n=1 Tax=Artemisia annua TaxID=35608 RepID=A0A2U1MAI6_ARTAN|nr:hypothetical protein CTI12_AA399120 [Artemisia annua]